MSRLDELIGALADAKTLEDAADQDVDDLKLRLRNAEKKLHDCIADTKAARQAVDREVEILSPSMFDLEPELRRIEFRGPEDCKRSC